MPVNRKGGRVVFEADGDLAPADASFLHRLRKDEIDNSRVKDLARRIAAFHAEAAASEPIAAAGRFEVVAANARANLRESAPQIGITVSSQVFRRVEALVESELCHLQPLIEGRARRGVPRDTHGDLRLEHVYLLPERAPPADLVIIDCIEFNERFRYGDPVLVMAFLVMDLTFQGRRDLAQSFGDAYFRASGDNEGRALLRFYSAYRAMVRGKVEGLRAAESEVPAAA